VHVSAVLGVARMTLLAALLAFQLVLELFSPFFRPHALPVAGAFRARGGGLTGPR
jgi:hypothetical protein